MNVNPLYTPRELKHQLNDAGAKAIVIVSNFAHTLETVVDETQVKHVILTRLGDQLPGAKGTIVNFVVKYIKRMVPKYSLPHATSMRLALRKGRRMQYVKPFINGEDIAFLQYTGGTTGLAKGAVLSHRNMVANVMQAKGMYGARLQEGRELIVTALPLYHVFALTVNGLLLFEMGGQNLLITNPRDIPTFVKEMSKVTVSAITGVNTLFNALNNNEDFKELDFSQLKLSVGGGMAVQRAVADRWQSITGCYLLEGYGLTECSPLVAAYPHDLTEFNGSIGLPVPSTEVRMVDDEGNELPMDGVGELQVRGPQVMQGYWQRNEATSEVLTEDGWLSTGDIVRFDEQGFLHIVDRKKI